MTGKEFDKAVPEKIPDDAYQVIYDECDGFVECGASAQVIWQSCRAKIARLLKEAKP